MPAAERTITIDRPVAEVFSFVADGRNGPRWRPGVLDIEHQSGEGVGAIYRQGVRGPGGRRIAADYEVTSYERTGSWRSGLSPGPSGRKVPTGSRLMPPGHG